MKRLAIALLVAGCGGDDSMPAQGDAAVDGAGTPDASADAPALGTFTITSPMLTQDATVATANTCDGANTSPELKWTGNAMSALSYAVVFTDKTNGLVHW